MTLKKIYNKYDEWRNAKIDADKKYKEFQEALKDHKDEFYEYLYKKNKKRKKK